MTVTPMNLIQHELVGLKTHVVASRDLGQVCKSGTVVAESREMIHLNTSAGVIQLPKSICVFDMRLPDGTVVRVDGHVLKGRPEDRLKKRLSRRW